jgi:hypothetical protein
MSAQGPMDKWVEREIAHARQVIANAKLVVTFSAAVAATFVSAELQKTDSTAWDEVALGLMGATLIFTFWVVLLRNKPHRFEDDPAPFDSARKTAEWAHWLMVVQVVLSAASVVAVVGQVRPEWR